MNQNTLNEAAKFAAANLKTLSQELLQWKGTGILALDGKFRELARMLSGLGATGALNLAESIVTTTMAQHFACEISEPPAHPDDEAVDRTAKAMKAKLAKKRNEGRSGWENKDQCTQEHLSSLLHEHVRKGDPVDVANLAMMIHQRGEAIVDIEDYSPNTSLDSLMLDYIEAHWFHRSLQGEWHFCGNDNWDAGNHPSFRDAVMYAMNNEGFVQVADSSCEDSGEINDH